MMPMAGQDAVLDRAAMERKTHVRAAIIHGVDLVALGDERECVAFDGDGKTTGRFHVGQPCGTHKPVRVGCWGHDQALLRAQVLRLHRAPCMASSVDAIMPFRCAVGSLQTCRDYYG